MDALGYSLTWRTRCFIAGGCGQEGLFAHTNGYGDFVLFDALGPPWPIHECYSRRFELANQANVLEIRGSRLLDVSGHPKQSWEVVTSVDADYDKDQAGINIIGTVISIEKKFVGHSKQFQDLSNKHKAEIKKTLSTCQSFIRVVTGEGYEYGHALSSR